MSEHVYVTFRALYTVSHCCALYRVHTLSLRHLSHWILAILFMCLPRPKVWLLGEGLCLGSQ